MLDTRVYPVISQKLCTIYCEEYTTYISREIYLLLWYQGALDSEPSLNATLCVSFLNLPSLSIFFFSISLKSNCCSCSSIWTSLRGNQYQIPHSLSPGYWWWQLWCMEGAIPHSLSELWLSVHLDGTLLPANDNDDAWKKRDVLVKLWLYGTLTKDLFKSTFKTGGTSREIWIRLENFFRNNKEAWPIQLDHKLRTKEIGDLTIHSYCQELKSIADLLANVDASVTERTLATKPFSQNENTAKTSNYCILWQCECCLPLPILFSTNEPST